MVTWQSAGVEILLRGWNRERLYRRGCNYRTVCKGGGAVKSHSLLHQELRDLFWLWWESVATMIGSKTLYKWSTFQVGMWSAYHLHRTGLFSTSAIGSFLRQMQKQQIFEQDSYGSWIFLPILGHCARCGTVQKVWAFIRISRKRADTTRGVADI